MLATVFKNAKGITEMSAPLSTRNEDLELESNTDIDPASEVLRETMPGVNDARRWLFPEPWEVWQSHPSCCKFAASDNEKLPGRSFGG